MPAPPNMRRTTTGPKAANSSRIASASTGGKPQLGSGFGCRLELYRFAAAAGRRLVRIVEYELRRELVGLIIHLGADQEQHRFGIDQDAHALVLDHLVGGLDLLGILHRVGHAGAAAVAD